MSPRQSTRSEALILARAGFIKSALQLLTPLVLVRLIDQNDFGEYRIFWLIANTATLVLPLGMARCLLFLLPKSTTVERAQYVSQTMAYFFGVALIAGIALSFGDLWLPQFVSSLTDPPFVLVAFSVLWILSTPLQYLPNADQNIRWQARSIILVSFLRVFIVVLVAWLTEDLQSVFRALAVWSLFQFAILIYYIRTRHGHGIRMPTWVGFKDQLNFAVPFGLARLLSGAVRQADQWIVIFLFAPASLAVFTIGTSFFVILNLAQTALGNVTLPKMSSSHAAGDTKRALELNKRGNVVIFAVVFPATVYLWIFAEQVISLLYTAHYVSAVPILRISLFALVLKCVDVGSILMIFEQGRFVARVSAGVLIFSVAISYVGALAFGLPGIVLGSIANELLSRFFNFRRAALLLGVKIGELQDWGLLLRIGLAALVAGITASIFGQVLISDQQSLLQLLVGGVVLAATYLLALLTFRLGWLVFVLAGRRKWTG